MDEETKTLNGLPEVPEESQYQEQETQEQKPEQQTEQQKQDDRDRNFARLREQKEKLERERDDLLYYMRQNMTPQHPQKQSQEEDAQLSDDDLVEWKVVNREIGKLRNELSNYKKEYTNLSAEQRLKQQYPDFDKVVSSDNVQMLRELYPEVAETLSESQNLYNKASSAYTMIKNLGIYKENSHSPEKDRAHQNMNKPRPLTSVGAQSGDSPLSKANAFAEGLTDDLKLKLRKEMADAIKRR